MKLHKIPENQKPLPAPCPYFPAQSPGGLDEFCRETAGNRKDCSLIYTWRRQCERWQPFVLLPVFGLKSRSCGKKASGQLSGGRTQAWTQISVAARAIDRAIRQQRSGTPPRIAGSEETWPGFYIFNDAQFSGTCGAAVSVWPSLTPKSRLFVLKEQKDSCHPCDSRMVEGGDFQSVVCAPLSGAWAATRGCTRERMRWHFGVCFF